MFEDIIVWYKRDKYNIILTVLCAFASAIPGIMSEYGSKDTAEGNYNFVLALGQFIIVCAGVAIIAFRYRPTALNDVNDKESLKDYIEEECGIKQTVRNDSDRAYRVVKGTVHQFFLAWLFIWLVWIVYYGIDIVLYSHYAEMKNAPYMKYAVMELKYILDFISSSALFSVYFILNNVTVDISNRSNRNSFGIFNSLSACFLLFSLLIILQILYLTHIDVNISSGNNYIQYDVFTKLTLGFFSAISFILVLGKLNSNYLEVPRILMLILYIYAVSQLFTMFRGSSTEKMGEYGLVAQKIEKLIPLVYSFGKTALLLALSWILYRKRLIFYILHKSLSITENKVKLNEFVRYMTK